MCIVVILQSIVISSRPIIIVAFRLAVATKASSVARLLKLRHVDLSIWMGDHQGRPGAVNLGRSSVWT